MTHDRHHPPAPHRDRSRANGRDAPGLNGRPPNGDSHVRDAGGWLPGADEEEDDTAEMAEGLDTIDHGWLPFLAAQHLDTDPPWQDGDDLFDLLGDMTATAEHSKATGPDHHVPEAGADGHGAGRRPGPGATLLLDLVSAVDHLRRGLRPGFTVWDAIEEALRWWVAARHERLHGATDPAEPAWDDPDPHAGTLASFLTALTTNGPPMTAPEALDQAITTWVITMARVYNAGYAWPHPQARRGLPPPLAGHDPPVTP